MPYEAALADIELAASYPAGSAERIAAATRALAEPRAERRLVRRRPRPRAPGASDGSRAGSASAADGDPTDEALSAG